MKILTPEQIKENNQKIIELHDNLESHIGSIYDLWIRESSNSRRTNLKRLNAWKLIEVKPLQFGTYAEPDRITFWIKIESPKGIHKGLIGEYVEKYILRG